MIHATTDSVPGRLRRFRTAGMPSRLAAAVTVFRLIVRLAPALALFALVFTDEPTLQWLSLLGFVPLTLAVLPGTPGCFGSCRAANPTAGPFLPPAH